MKAIMLTMFMSLAVICASAQFFISCDQRTYCKWNDNTHEYQDCSTWEDNSMFEINEDVTMFTHTTSNMKSSYYTSIPKLKKIKNGKILKTKQLEYFAVTNISPKLVL